MTNYQHKLAQLKIEKQNDQAVRIQAVSNRYRADQESIANRVLSGEKITADYLKVASNIRNQKLEQVINEAANYGFIVKGRTVHEAVLTRPAQNYKVRPTITLGIKVSWTRSRELYVSVLPNGQIRVFHDGPLSTSELRAMYTQSERDAIVQLAVQDSSESWQPPAQPSLVSNVISACQYFYLKHPIPIIFLILSTVLLLTISVPFVLSIIFS